MASNYEARNLTITSRVLDSEGRGEQVQSQILAPKAQPSPGGLEFSSNWSNGGWTITNRISSADSELAKSLLDEAGRIRDGVVAQQNEFILGLRSD